MAHWRRIGIMAAVLGLLGADAAKGQLGGFGLEDDVKVTLEAQLSAGSVAPGGNAVAAVVLDHTAGWHSWPNAGVDLGPEFDFAIRTTIEPGADGLTFGPIQWPETHLAPVPSLTGEPVEKPVFEGRAVIYVPFEVDAGMEPGSEIVLELLVGYQSCDESMCLMPEQVALPLTVRVAAPGEPAGAGESELFAGFDPAVFADRERWGEAAQPSASAAPKRTFFGLGVPEPTDPAGVAIIALLAAAGGLILNLTPCVLPVIPIKVMTLSHHASNKGKSLVLGLWMAAGVIAFWLALGVVAVSFTSWADPSRLFGIWWVTAIIGVAIAALGVGLLGAFDITLPKWVYTIAPTPDTAHGSLLFGVMTAVLGLPCFGFVAGALLVGSATMPGAVVLTIFTGIGVGMALPYLVLAVFPGLVNRIPRTGPGSDLVKQIMGLLMLAAAAYFLGAGAIAFVGGRPDWLASLPWWATSVHWWVIGLFALAAGVWLVWRTMQITKRWARRAGIALLALVISAGGLAAAGDRTYHAYHNFWIPFTPETYAAALDSGQVVVLDFTAEWCLNCKALEATVLARDPVRSELVGADVTPLVADLTSTAAPGWDRLRAFGQTGIPLLVIDGPGLDEPWQANAYTPAMVLEALDRARGGGVADARP